MFVGTAKRKHSHNILSSDEKILNLCQHPITSQLRAVRNRSYISVPFSGSTLGVKIGSLSYNLAEAIVALALEKPLPSLEFSSIIVSYDNDDASEGATGSQAVTLSGVKVYTTLPTFNGINLEATCAAEAPEILIGDSDEDEAGNQGEAPETETVEDEEDEGGGEVSDPTPPPAESPNSDISATSDESSNGEKLFGTLSFAAAASAVVVLAHY